MRADGVWKHFYARLCIVCLTAKVLPFDIDYSSDERLRCPSCGMDTEVDYDAVYVTFFAPKSTQVDVEAPFCGVHAAEYRIWVQGFARDTDISDGATEPHHESTGAATAYRGLGRLDPGARQ